MKMGRGKNDFVLDSKGRCFLCLDNIKLSLVKHEQCSVAPPFPKYSIYYLSRYLKMNMRKVFKDTEHIPSELLANVESSRLKVELCDECVSLTEQFSEDYRKLEKAEMELGSCLRRIHAKFLDTKENGKPREFKNLLQVEPHLKSSSSGELEILEVLREEAFQKSHNKLRAAMPRLKFRNLTENAIRRKQFRFKAVINISKENQKTPFPVSSLGNSLKSQLDESEVKMEVETLESASDHGDYHCPLDDSNTHNDDMGDDAEDTLLKEEVDNDFYHNTKPKTKMFASLVAKMPHKSKPEVSVPEATIVSKTGKHKCDTCSKEFTSKAGYRFHYESIHLKLRFKCVTCGMEFSHQSACNRHQKSVHVGVRYACSVCNKAFTQSGDVRNHQRKTDCGKKLTPKKTKHLNAEKSSS